MQPILVVFAVVAVPWMLLIKPFMLRREHKKALAAKGSTVHYDNTVCIQYLLCNQMRQVICTHLYQFRVAVVFILFLLNILTMLYV